MSYDHYIINHTRKERVHFDRILRRSSIEESPKITLAYLSYLFDTKEDDVKIMQDDGDYMDIYKDVDLSKKELND